MTTPCRARLCKNLVKSRLMKGYCDEHAHLRHGWQHNKSASERGYDSQWKRLRLQVLKRDKYLCQMCKADTRYTHATDVDHTYPRRKVAQTIWQTCSHFVVLVTRLRQCRMGGAGKKFGKIVL